MPGHAARCTACRLIVAVGGALTLVLLAGPAVAAADDQIFPGNVCIGLPCVTGEPFSGPVLKLKSSDTPALTLEQPSGTYPAQAWDVGGNDENFFVRDQTGPTLPLRIRPRAPTSSIDVAANGNVGIDGTGEAAPPLPTAALQVSRTNGTAQLRVQETSATVAPRVLTELANNGPAQIAFQDSSPGGTSWAAGSAAGGTFVVAAPGQSSVALTVRPSGDVQAGGTLVQSADPAQIRGGSPANTTKILRALATLPLVTFRLGSDPALATHLAPSGGAFRAAFGLGADDATIAPSDMAGVALAAVQRLAKTPPGSDPRVGKAVKDLAKTTKRVKTLETSNRRLTTRVKTLEKQMKALLRRRG